MASQRTKILLAATSLLALGACGDRKVFSSWHEEAGAFIDEGGFGNATMNNTGIQNGDLSYVLNLNARFNREVPTVVEFEFNSAQITNAARLALDAQARWIAQFPEVRFRVYGHTDLVGSTAYNKALGLRRANAVVNFLVSRGISRSRLEAVVSFGETQPIIYTDQPEMRNRRAVTEVTGFVKNHPLILNGKYAEVIFREYVASATELPPGGSAESNF
ncbi:OmpA family protein [Psychromarinibacter sp. S121]|uniref:OmpA family protein n=1 Tax=Psychromarinibacter sp. S121 TaxID=3415127 RepID=UPI003C7B8114